MTLADHGSPFRIGNDRIFMRVGDDVRVPGRGFACWNATRQRTEYIARGLAGKRLRLLAVDVDEASITEWKYSGGRPVPSWLFTRRARVLHEFDREELAELAAGGTVDEVLGR